jgi:hypothetical protein
MVERTWEQGRTIRRFLPRKIGRLCAVTDVFERLRHSPFKEPIWQPVIFAVLLVLIFIVLVLITRT